MQILSPVGPPAGVAPKSVSSLKAKRRLCAQEYPEGDRTRESSKTVSREAPLQRVEDSVRTKVYCWSRYNP